MFGPNITGEVGLERPLWPAGGLATGPFSTRWEGSYRQSFEGSYGTAGYNILSFKASSSSSVYQGSTVQPASVRLLPVIKF